VNNPKSRDDLVLEFDLPVHKLNMILSMLEIKSAVKEELGLIRRMW